MPSKPEPVFYLFAGSCIIALAFNVWNAARQLDPQYKAQQIKRIEAQAAQVKKDAAAAAYRAKNGPWSFDDPDLQVLDYRDKYDADLDDTYIVGTAENTGSEPYSYVSVTFNLFDKDGNQVGTAFDNTTYLAAGGKWKFKALGHCDFASYKIANIHGRR